MFLFNAFELPVSAFATSLIYGGSAFAARVFDAAKTPARPKVARSDRGFLFAYHFNYAVGMQRTQRIGFVVQGMGYLVWLDRHRSPNAEPGIRLFGFSV